jgi:hypothetical protein
VTRRSTAAATVVALLGTLAPVSAQGDHTLGALVRAVTERTGVTAFVAPEIEQDPVSAKVQGLPADRALRELVKQYDAFFFYGGTASTPAELRGVWVYPKGTASMLRPVPAEAWASSEELTTLLARADAGTREQIYESLMARPDPASQDALVQALRGTTEADAELRERLLSSAISKGLPLPAQLLRDLALADSAEAIRLMALDALAFEDDATNVVQAALADPSEAVRDRAAQILEQIRTSRN